MEAKDTIKQNFSKKLNQKMIAKGWNQSELARQAGLPRDAISVYIRGKSRPTPENLQKLADALGCNPEDLLSGRHQHTEDQTSPSPDEPHFEFRALNPPNKGWLRFNQLVSLSAMSKIADILREDASRDEH